MAHFAELTTLIIVAVVVIARMIYLSCRFRFPEKELKRARRELVSGRLR